jgi:hypothetical protein
MNPGDFWRVTKFEWFEICGWLALVGVSLMLASSFVEVEPVVATILLVSGILLLMPFIFHLHLLTIWHWKERYRGDHSLLWGALILLETSSWFKLIYLFRHIIPDRRGTGRYVRVAGAAGGSS